MRLQFPINQLAESLQLLRPVAWEALGPLRAQRHLLPAAVDCRQTPSVPDCCLSVWWATQKMASPVSAQLQRLPASAQPTGRATNHLQPPPAPLLARL